MVGETVGFDVVGESDGDTVGKDMVGEMVGDAVGDIEGDKLPHNTCSPRPQNCSSRRLFIILADWEQFGSADSGKLQLKYVTCCTPGMSSNICAC